MSIQAPQGILNIPNAILRVGKLSVDEVVGADTILNTVARNTILLVDDEAYHENKNWSLKLPNAWAGEFECNTASAGNYSEFNFYNEGASSNAQGYNLTFNDTAVELRYDGTLLKTGTLASTITGTGVKKVRLMFERTILSVTVDGTLVFTHDDTYGPRPRVYSTTAGGFLNFFTNGGALKNLKIVNEKWMSDGTSNIAYVGGGEVAVGQALAFNRVSNVSQIKVDSNVVTEYTGPHDRPLRKYPEVAMTADAETASGYKGYKVTASVDNTNTFLNKWRIFNGLTGNEGWVTNGSLYDSGNDFEYISGGTSTLGGVSGEWVKLELPTKIRLSRIVMTARNLSAEQHPEDFQILGSNDDSNWTQVMNVVGAPFTQGSTLTFNVTGNVEHFKYLAVIVTRTVGWSAAAISELEYYGYEEGSGSLDTTLKSVYNVPATTGTQLEVYYDGQDYTQASDFTGTGGVVDKAGGDQDGTAGTGVSFDPTYKAFVFDGTTNGKITTSIINDIGDWVHSASVWVKVETGQVAATSAYISLLGTTDSAGTRIAFDYKEDESAIRLGINAAFVQWNNVIVPNQWHHITYTYKGGSISGENYNLYVDGKYVEYSTLQGTSTLTLAQNTTLSLGQSHLATNYFTGSIANFRLYSKALNADQVKELYDYQKDYFLGSKSQVTLYKGHLGVGVTEPSGQLELAGDERIQEYPPRGMTDFDTYIEGHGVFKASATSHGGSIGTSKYHAWKAFNKDRTDANNGDNSWLNGPDISGGDYNTSTGVYEGTEKHHGGAPIGAALQLSMPYEIYLKGYSLAPWNYATGTDFQYADSPSDFIIYGSKDNVNWVQIDSRTGQGMSSQTDIKRFSLDTRDSYSHFAIVVTKNNTAAYPSTSASFVAIEEWRLFGTPGPTTLDKGSLTLGRSLDVPRVSRYDVDTETPRPEKLVLDLDTTVNSSPTDISGRGNHGAFKSNCTYFPADKAFDFPGDGDRIDGCTFNGYSGPVIQSHSYWVKGATANVRSPVTVGRAIGGTSGEYLSLLVDTGGWQINADGWSHDYDETIDTTRWYHVVVTYDGGSSTSSYKLYIDGEYKTPTGSNGTFGSLSLEADTVIRIGRDSGVGWFTGMISNIKIYDVALEPSEVQKLYQLGPNRAVHGHQRHGRRHRESP
jgi:hypothetical protein